MHHPVSPCSTRCHYVPSGIIMYHERINIIYHYLPSCAIKHHHVSLSVIMCLACQVTANPHRTSVVESHAPTPAATQTLQHQMDTVRRGLCTPHKGQPLPSHIPAWGYPAGLRVWYTGHYHSIQRHTMCHPLQWVLAVAHPSLSKGQRWPCHCPRQ